MLSAAAAILYIRSSACAMIGFIIYDVRPSMRVSKDILNAKFVVEKNENNLVPQLIAKLIISVFLQKKLIISL